MFGRLFVWMNWLGIAGVVLVVALLCAAALGKWKGRIAFRCMCWFSVAGIAIPVALFLTGTYANALNFNVQGVAENISYALWPNSIALMALTRNGSTAFELSVIATLILINAGLYGIVGLLVGYSWQGILHFHKEGK